MSVRACVCAYLAVRSCELLRFPGNWWEEENDESLQPYQHCCRLVTKTAVIFLTPPEGTFPRTACVTVAIKKRDGKH